MIIGVTKEIKNGENRVGMTPHDVPLFIKQGHQVLIEKGAGLGSSFTDEEYQQAGATLLNSAAEVWQKSEMIIKVKEPLPSEYQYFRKGLIIFTYLHLAADLELTEALLKKEVVGIAYETVELEDHSLPLLIPMSQVAGRMSIQVGAHFLEKYTGGRGVLLGGVENVKPGTVVIIGGGNVGHNACQMATGLGAHVILLDPKEEVLKKYQQEFGKQITTLFSNPENIANSVKQADLLVCAVLIHGAKAPHLVSEAMVKTMKKGSVIIDVSIDQGGIVETIDHVTTHEHPTFEKYGVIHYSVANMPGAVPQTSTLALTAATMKYALALAKSGWQKAISEDAALKRGVNTAFGKITYHAVAEAFNKTYTPIEDLIHE